VGRKLLRGNIRNKRVFFSPLNQLDRILSTLISFLEVLGFEIRALHFGRQALYHLMLPAFFGLIYFSDRILHFCLGQP
jgi:hypothetical protein